MKKSIIYTISGIFLLAGLVSCEDYLDRDPAATTGVKDIFGKYETFQGYEDGMFLELVDPLAVQQKGGMWFSDETHSTAPLSNPYNAIAGDYWSLLTGGYSLFVSPKQNGNGRSTTTSEGSGFWTSSWKAIRRANIALSQLPTLEAAQTATQEQKNLLKGTALFFRGFNHLQIMQIWGGLPYIDTLLTPTTNINFPRPNVKDALRKAVVDLTTAAQLLPKNWDETADGAITPGKNQGRPTSGAAYGMAAKALLFMGSPLNNNNFEYNEALCKESAQLGWEVIKLADAGYHSLLRVTEDKGDPDILDYKRNFVGFPYNASPYTQENLLVKYGNSTYFEWNSGPFGASLAFNMFPRSSNGLGASVAATQNIVDLFETENGKLPEDDPLYDPLNPWKNRDPRFYNTILTDGTPITSNYSIQCYAYDDKGVPGRDFGPGQTETGYYIKKWWIYGCTNQSGGNRTGVNIWTPLFRLSEVYLNYAEALIAAGYAPTAAPVFDNGQTGISALEAVNRVRGRIYTKTNLPILPPVDMTLYGGSGKDGTVKGSFMKKIWDERSVELCFETNRWIDLRRWHVAHLDKYRKIYGMRFDKAKTTFERVLLATINFDSKHYWMPIPRDQVGIYQEYTQNPGW
jgi:hypothetical protein